MTEIANKSSASLANVRNVIGAQFKHNKFRLPLWQAPKYTAGQKTAVNNMVVNPFWFTSSRKLPREHFNELFRIFCSLQE